MASSDPVEVAVEIIDQFTDDLQKLEKQLDRIDGKKLSVKLDIDDGGDIAEVKALLEELEKNLKTKLDIDIVGEKEALALKKALEKNTKSVHRIITKESGVPSGGGGDGGGGGGLPGTPHRGRRDITDTVNEIVSDNLKRLSLDGNPERFEFTMGREGHLFGEDGMPMDLSNPETDFMRRIKKGTRTPPDIAPKVPLGPMRDRPGLSRDQLNKQIGGNRRRNMVGNAVRNTASRVGSSISTFKKRAGGFDPIDFSGMTSSFSKVSKAIMKHKPSIMMWWQLIALLIPMLITLAGAALGVVAAFAAMATAGAAIIGIGILGYGDSMTDSLEEFKKRLKSVGKDVFGILRPASAAFQPILDGWIGGIPGQIQKLVDPLMRLTEFESVLSKAGGGIAGWVGRGLTAMADLSDMIEQIGLRFGGIFGDLIINLLVWATKELYKNQDAFVSLGRLLGSLISIIYNLAKIVSFVVAVFTPFFKILAKIVEKLSNKWTVALLAVASFLFLMHGAVLAVISAYGTLMGINLTLWALTALAGIEKIIMGLYGWVVAANTAYGAMARLLALTGVGLIAVAGSYAVGKAAMSGMDGPSGGGYSGGGGSGYGGRGGGVNITVQGDMSNRAYQRVKDDFPEWYGTESGIDSATQR
jgi:hypothetical protein